jgi:hypothetical protein
MQVDLRARWAKHALPPAAILVAAGSAWTFGARGAKPTLATPPCSAQVDIAAVVARDPDYFRHNKEVDSIFAATIAEVNSARPTSRYEQITLLGKLLLHDSALANPKQQILTQDEQAGWMLFRGKARCNTCHVDGTDNRGGAGPPRAEDRIAPRDAADQFPLFTDFTAANLGVPRNPALRFYCEAKPSQAGYTANPAGAGFVDRGVGAFLRSSGNPNPAWARMADKFDGMMRVPTLRNADLRPRPDFVKPYMHNGYLKSLKEVVHF